MKYKHHQEESAKRNPVYLLPEAGKRTDVRHTHQFHNYEMRPENSETVENGGSYAHLPTFKEVSRTERAVPLLIIDGNFLKPTIHDSLYELIQTTAKESTWFLENVLFLKRILFFSKLISSKNRDDETKNEVYSSLKLSTQNHICN